MSFRALPILEVKAAGKVQDPEKARDAGSGPKVMIETEVAKSQEPNPQSAIRNSQSPKAPNPSMAEGQSAIRNPQSVIADGTGSGMNLTTIRSQIANRQRKKEELTKLNEELLHQAWGQYIERLIEQKNPSAVTNFKHAVLRVIDENTFEISTESVIQQKFIEQERGQLIAHLQDFFKNRQLTYQLVLLQKEDTESAKEKPLSSREQYLKIIEMYPLVKELKDRLGMDLDY